MKHGKVATRNQKEILKKNNIDPQKWLVIKNYPDRFEIVNRDDNQERKIIRY